jgi:ABC-type thiamin/hydroxymethylpyrimidine transport system permease subunit
MFSQINQKSKSNFLKLFFGVCFLFFGIYGNAQCAMCRASLESEGNLQKGQAVNDGIVYLMVIPYILAAVLAYVIYRMYKKKDS